MKSKKITWRSLLDKELDDAEGNQDQLEVLGFELQDIMDDIQNQLEELRYQELGIEDAGKIQPGEEK